MTLVLQHYDIASKAAISNAILSLGFDTCLGVTVTVSEVNIMRNVFPVVM